RDAGHEAHRPQVHVQLELAPDRDEESPQRHVVRHAGKAHRAEEDRVVVADLREAVLGHHAPVLPVVLAAPGLLVPLEREAELARRRLEYALALGHHFPADAIPGDHRDAMVGDRPWFCFGDRPWFCFGDRPWLSFGDRPWLSFGDRPWFCLCLVQGLSPVSALLAHSKNLSSSSTTRSGTSSGR